VPLAPKSTAKFVTGPNPPALLSAHVGLVNPAVLVMVIEANPADTVSVLQVIAPTTFKAALSVTFPANTAVLEAVSGPLIVTPLVNVTPPAILAPEAVTVVPLATVIPELNVAPPETVSPPWKAWETVQVFPPVIVPPVSLNTAVSRELRRVARSALTSADRMTVPAEKVTNEPGAAT